MSKKGRTSASNASYRTRRRKSRAAKLRAEERSWAAQSGPVVIYYRPTAAPDDLSAA